MVNKRDLSLRTPGISGSFAIKKPTGGGSQGGRTGVAGVGVLWQFCDLDTFQTHCCTLLTHFLSKCRHRRHPADTLPTPNATPFVT